MGKAHETRRDRADVNAPHCGACGVADTRRKALMPVDQHAERADDDNCRPKGRHGFRISPRPLRIAITSQNTAMRPILANRTKPRWSPGALCWQRFAQVAKPSAVANSTKMTLSYWVCWPS